MTPKKFKEICVEIQGEGDRVMLGKRAEYSPTEKDVLQNFREVAAFEGRQPAEVVISYLMKHLQSMRLAAKSGNYVWAMEKEDGSEGMKQRLVDARNYIYLLAGALAEQKGNAPTPTLPSWIDVLYGHKYHGEIYYPVEYRKPRIGDVFLPNSLDHHPTGVVPLTAFMNGTEKRIILKPNRK